MDNTDLALHKDISSIQNPLDNPTQPIISSYIIHGWNDSHTEDYISFFRDVLRGILEHDYIIKVCNTLLTKENVLTDELALRGLSMVYDIYNKPYPKQLVKSLKSIYIPKPPKSTEMSTQTDVEPLNLLANISSIEEDRTSLIEEVYESTAHKVCTTEPDPIETFLKYNINNNLQGLDKDYHPTWWESCLNLFKCTDKSSIIETPLSPINQEILNTSIEVITTLSRILYV